METPGLKSQLFPVELSQMETRTPGFPWKKKQQQPDPDGFPKLELEPPHAGGIKPKGEPCEEQEHSPAAAPDDDWEVTPLSGDHPFFTTVMSKSQVQKQFQLVRRGTHAMPCIIPSGSASGSSLTLKEGILSCAHQVIPARLQRLLPEARVPAALLCRGRSWAASYCGDLKCKKIDAGWRDFAVDNALRVGDACVFELITAPAAAGSSAASSEVVFRVQVLRGGLPEEITSKGATPDEPLVIVD